MDTVRLRGAGGVEFTFDLPLAPQYQDQLDRGHLQPVSGEDEAVLAAQVEPAPEPEAPAEPVVKKAVAAKKAAKKTGA